MTIGFPQLVHSGRWQRLKAIALCAAALVAATLVSGPHAELPHIAPDSCQYLSAAHHLRTAHRMETSLVHFDTERSQGRIPAKLTWFPPGYPAAIAFASALAGGYETGALWISMLSFVLVTMGLWHLMRLLDPSRWAAAAATLCWIANSHALYASGAALSEPLFTLLGIANLLLLLHADASHNNRRAWLYWTAAAVTAGLSYWVRYAGLLFLAANLAVLCARVMSGKVSRRIAVTAAATAILLAVPLMIRNLVLVGDWRGGNNIPFSRPLRAFAADTPKVWYHLVLGDASASRLGLPAALVSIGLIGLGAVTWMKTMRSAGYPLRQRIPLPAARGWIVLTVFMTYVSGMTVIAQRSVISYIPRMYVPVLPHLIALMVISVSLAIRHLPSRGWQRQFTAGMAACILIGYLTGNVISSGANPPDAFQQTEEALFARDASGLSMQGLITREIGGNAAIAATNGQTVGYLLKRPTLSLVGRPFSSVTWNEPMLRAEMARFGAKYLLLSRDPAADPVVQQSEFLGALARGATVPWLRLMAENRDMYVYRVQ
ncbi:MAG TPA: glycosyltransferase family 39 protein [Candidatus Acidoferrales bacterium]|nr:glycosyltransferase family 39 protein [Candidatus Acidoferrales bacterium]